MNPIKKWRENYSKQVDKKRATHIEYARLFGIYSAGLADKNNTELKITEQLKVDSNRLPYFESPEYMNKKKACIYNIAITHEEVLGGYDLLNRVLEEEYIETKTTKCPYFKPNGICDQTDCRNFNQNEEYNIASALVVKSKGACDKYLVELSEKMRKKVLKRARQFLQNQL